MWNEITSHDLLQHNTQAAFVYANFHDCRRYGVIPILGYWAREWIKEKINPANLLGVFVNAPDGNYFEIHQELKQPHPFHNLIIPQQSIHPGLVIDRKIPLNALPTCKQKFTQICSMRGLQCLTDQELEFFFTQVEEKLEVNGSFFFAATHYFNLNGAAAEVLSNSPLLKRLNLQIPHPGGISLKRIQSYSPRLEPLNYLNIDYAPGGNRYNERYILENNDILKISCGVQFQQKHPGDELAMLTAAKDVLMTAIGFVLIKSY